MTTPSNAELRDAILKRVLKIDVYDDTEIDEDEAKAAADDLVKLFQAREQQLLSELLGELPKKKSTFASSYDEVVIDRPKLVSKTAQLLLEARIEELQKLPKLCLIDEHKLSDHIEELKALGTNQ